MNDIALSSLRVAAEIDASKYKTGADQKIASDRAMIASAQAIGATFSQTDSKISTAGDSLARLSRQYLDGYKNQERFEQGLRQIGRQLDSGKTDIDGATRLLVGMNQKLGLTADVSQLAAKGQTQLAAAVSMANTQIEGQAVALQQAAAAHAALIAQARADQAAENSRQMAAANQGSFNSVLGVASPSSGAQASASVFEAEFSRLEQMARLRAQQAGAIFADEFNSSVMVNSGKSARASASVFEEAGKEADQMALRVAALRAELNPTAAAQDRLNAELSEYSALAAKGAISAEELAQAQTMARTRVAANQNGQGVANFAGMNATSQIQDIAITSMMGQSVPTIALQQGTQLGMAMQMAMGDKGAAGGAKALLAGLTGLISPVNLVAIGLTAVVAIGIQFGSKLLPQTKSLKDATNDQRKAVNDLAEAYGMAGVKAEDFGKKSQAAAASAARRETDALSAAARSANTDTLNSLARFVVPGYHQSGVYQARSEFSDFAAPIADLSKGLQTAHPDFQTFERDTQAIVDKNPGLQGIRDKIMGIAEAAMAASGNLGGTAKVLDRINQIRLPEKGILPKGAAGDALAADEIAAKYRMQQQFAADQLGLNARSPQELAAAARAREAINPEGDAGTQATRVELAGKKALIEAEHQLKEAQDQRLRSLDQTLASAKLDVDLIGKTTAEVEGLRMAAQLEAQVREEAARNHTKADEAEIARIKEKAAEYGKLRALQEARDTIHNQEIDLETQKAEVATVGENTLARQRAAAALKTEQDIRKLGIPLYGQEANAMRANTAALSDQAAALAKASMQADLLFERSQILRNSDDQQIASALKSAGLPIDLNSAEANMMRYNMALQETKDTFKGFFTDMVDGLKQGKSLWGSLEGAAVNALSKIADKLIDRGLDGIFNSLFGGQSSGGGLLGDLLSGNSGSSQSNSSTGGASSFLGKLFGGAGGPSVASMQVQAATVFINGAAVGGVGGGLSDILSELGSSSFKADTTLSDILGYGGAANQNTIQSRIDQAFGTGGSAQDMIQSRIDQAFGTAGGLGGIFSPSGGFASVLGGSGMTGSISQYASAIKMIESAGSGGYSALGPLLKSGDQALGAYQVMKSNLPSWSTEAFGKAMSPSQFLSNPAAQDTIFQQQFGKLLDKYGNSNDAASAWFTGGPLSKGAGKSDVLGTTGSQYVDKFNAALQKVTGTASQATGALGGLGSASEGLISQFSKMGQSLLSQLTPATSSSSWFQGLAGMFGGSSGALGFMNSISPAATSDILSGSWGLFDSGGYTGSGGRKDPAGIVHRGEVVWSQEDVARAGGVHVVEGMRRGYGGYADGGVVRSRMRYDGTPSPRQSSSPSAANDRPAQNIQQTINYNITEKPMSPASQNQNAARNARALERLTRTS